ncbi:MAG: hypothetical protein ABIJ04_08165 [Bacteroidota bacterium]
MTVREGDHHTTHPPSQKEPLLPVGAANIHCSQIYFRILTIEVQYHGNYQ